MSRDQRWLLCRPASGLSDIFSQIGLAIVHADRYRRVVIVDTNPPHTRYFRDSLSNYFISLRDDLILDIPGRAEWLDGLGAVPRAVAGRISSYHAVYDPAVGGYVDAASRAPLALDFTRDYAEPLLIHHAGGRSPYPLLPLTRMRLQDRVRDEIDRRLASIGGPFDGVHIRATDLKTDYERVIDALRDKLVPKIFVATDNRAALACVRERCPDAEIHSFARLPAEAGRPLHICPDPDMIWEINLDAIADVLLLAHARRLHYFSLQPNRVGARLSGYSMLANELRRRPVLLRQLMSRPGIRK